MERRKKSGQQRKSVSSRRRKGRTLLNYRRIFPVLALICLLVFTLGVVGYVIFFRTVFA